VWELGFTSAAEKALAAMPGAERTALQARLERLARGDIAGLNLRKLRGQADVWRIRSGDWRAGFTYRTVERVLLVLWIARRDVAYR
jgi:mRNA-degrading endonuclease RelE of RelBE toxin-antitoxin system